MAHPVDLSLLCSKARLLALLFLAMAPLAVIATTTNKLGVPSTDYSPSPELEPAEVVRIQVEALRSNSPYNEGIELTYRFASPGNKRHTGPLHRFVDMVRSAPYHRLLNHRSAQYSPMAVSGNQAQQVVVIIDAEGNEIAYVWVLSRQTEGVYKDCWMTDAVLPAEREVQRQLTHLALSLSRIVHSPEVNRPAG